MDKNGDIYGYVSEPQSDFDGWRDGNCPIWISSVVKIDTTGTDWRTSLTKRPKCK